MLKPLTVIAPRPNVVIRTAALIMAFLIFFPVRSVAAQVVQIDSEAVVLSEDSRKALQEIKDRLEAARVLKRILAVAPFISLFASPPPDAAIEITSTDWDLWTDAVTVVDVIVRKSIYDLCILEALKYKGGAEHKFWIKMSEAFK